MARPALAMGLVAVLGVAGCATSSGASRGGVSGSPSVSSSPGGSPGADGCRDPREHVYHPDRLQLRNPCMTVTGSVEAVIAEADGDYHIRLRLDSQFADLLHAGNGS